VLCREDLFKGQALRALVYGDCVFADTDLRDAASEVAVGLRSIDARSPFVHLFAENHPKTVVALRGILQAGFVCVLLDPAMAPSEYCEIRRDTWPRAVLRFGASEPSLRLTRPEICSVPDRSEAAFDVDPDICLIAYTAAEDGRAKGAQLTAEGLRAVAESTNSDLGFGPDDVSCALLPFDHLFGILTGVLAPMLGGTTTVIADPRGLGSLEQVADAVEKYRINMLYSVPAALHFLARVPEGRAKLARLATCVSGGAPLASELFEFFRDRLGIELREGYGLTEASPSCTVNPRGGARALSVGPAQRHCELSVQDEQGGALPAGARGELCVRGKNVMRGYWNQPEATARTLRGGWLHTGDLAELDRDGFVYLKGLAKRMFLVGGRNVYPAEVERILRQNPNVRDAELYAEPDPLLGHRIIARVVLAKNDRLARTELRAWCQKRMSRFKIPTIFHAVAEPSGAALVA